MSLVDNVRFSVIWGTATVAAPLPVLGVEINEGL